MTSCADPQIAVRAYAIYREREAQFIRWGPMAHVPRYSADGQASVELSAEEIWREAEMPEGETQ